MKKLFFTIAFVLVSQLGFSQDAFKKDILRYLEISGQVNTFRMLTKDLSSNIPESKRADFQKELDASINDLMSKMADMYMTEFTHEDIKSLLKFYDSEVGKKLASKTEVLYAKGQQVGQDWGQGIQSLMMKYMQ